MSKSNLKTRIAELREKVKSANEKAGPTFDVPYQGKRVPFRRFKLDSSFPLYNLKSGRTHRGQAEYLDGHPRLPVGFFDDPEDPDVQKAQHEILRKMISVKDLDTDLKKIGQHDPLVLTYDGYVIDGNRRLTALREAREAYVEVVVLPEDAGVREIYETEIELQMQRETKAEYDWIDQACHVRYGMDVLNEPTDRIAARMRITVDGVNKAIEKLGLVDQYLAHTGEPAKYHKVPKESEQAFEDILLGLRRLKLKSEPERRTVRITCFTALKGGAGYEDIRKLIKQMGKNPEEVVGKLLLAAPSLKPTPAPTKKDAEKKGPEKKDPFNKFASAQPSKAQKPVDDLDAILEDTSKQSDAGKAIVEVVNNLDEEEREAKKTQSQAPLQRIQKALGDIEKVELGPTTERLPDIDGALSKLREHIDRLQQQVRELAPKKKK